MHTTKQKTKKVKRSVTIAVACIAALQFFSCSQNNVQLQRITGVQKPVDSTYATDPEIDAMIRPFREKLNAQLDATLCVSTYDFSKTDGVLETSMGNLVADITLEQTQDLFKKRYDKEIDMVLMNWGGVRASISKGNVTARNAYQVMPFENELVVTELSYEKMQELISYLIKGKTAHPTAQLDLEIDQNTETAVITKVNGRTLEVGQTYNVLTTDYLQGGGDRMNFFKDPITLYNLDYKFRNALIDYFTKVDTLTGKLDNRVRYAK